MTPLEILVSALAALLAVWAFGYWASKGRNPLGLWERPKDEE